MEETEWSKKILKEEINSKMNHKSDIKDTRLIIGYKYGSLAQHLLEHEKIIHECEYLNEHGSDIRSIAIAHNNKSFFVEACYGNLYQYDIDSHKCIKKFTKMSFSRMILTYNGRYFIAHNYNSHNIDIQSARTQKRIQSLNLKELSCPRLITCSYDSKYLFIACGDKLLILDIKKCQQLETIKPFTRFFYSFSFYGDNENAIIGDTHGNIKKLSWGKNDNTVNDFKITEDYGRIGGNWTESICLTDDEENLIVGSVGSIKIFNFEKRQVIKEFKLKSYVRDIELIEDGKKAAIVMWNGHLTILDLKLLEVSKKLYINSDNRRIECVRVIC